MFVPLSEVSPTLCPFSHKETGGKLSSNMLMATEMVSGTRGVEPTLLEPPRLCITPLYKKKV